MNRSFTAGLIASIITGAALTAHAESSSMGLRDLIGQGLVQRSGKIGNTRYRIEGS